MSKINYYSLEIKEIIEKLKTNSNEGLKTSQILELQKKHGANSFEKKKDWGILGKIISQFKSPLIFILFFAGVLTVFLQEYTDALVIFLAVFINTVIGTFQENKASQAFEKLSHSQQKYATVIREGKKSLIFAQELTIGDIVLLSPGVYIPADIRLIENKNILVNESVLTGEWVDVSKTTEPIVTEKEIPILKQTNMLWMGTLISGGGGKGIVVSIGNNTQLGEVAKSLGKMSDEKTPLKKNVEKIAENLVVILITSIIFIFILGILKGESLISMVLISIAVAVAVIPEGLPAAVTSVLALGMWKILQKGGLVKNLLAAETLGSTTFILTDKTGTLTEAKMKLVEIFTLEAIETKNSELENGDNKKVLEMAVLSSDAFIEEDKNSEDKLVVIGRPLEKAMVLAGLEFGISQSEFLKHSKRLDLMDFESGVGFSASLNMNGKVGKNRLFLSGKPEFLLENSKFIYHNGIKKELTPELIKVFEKIQKEKSSEGMRFTAIAFKDVDWKEIPEGKNKIQLLTPDLIFAGFLVFNDPVRKDVKEAIGITKKAGVEVVMVTGDNPNTAKKIAEEVGIIKKGAEILTGTDIEDMSDGELFEKLKKNRVFARIIPSQKLRILKILQKNGEVVAMTGDGINDAPALQGADIGIAVSNATEVAKEASDIILLDSDFSVITYSIREGRKIVDNLRKIVGYLLSTSLSEILLIGGSLFATLPLPILPTQILWANIVGEGLMNFAFVFEPGEDDLMKRNPRSSLTTNILTERIKKLIWITSFVTGTFLLFIYIFLSNLNFDIEKTRTIIFVALSTGSIFFAFSLKALSKPIWKINLFSNRYLIFSMFISIAFLLIAMFFEPIRNILSLVKLSYSELLFLVGIGIFNLFIIEVIKYFIFERK